MSSRLPTLGPRGEGWVVLQSILLAGVLLAGLEGGAWSGAVRMVTSLIGIALILAGVGLAARGALDLGSGLTPLPRPGANARLVESGAYALARHPIYGGIVIAAFGWGLLTASPLALGGAAVTLVFFDLKSRREEAWLDERFEGYRSYRARTRRLIPWLY